MKLSKLRQLGLHLISDSSGYVLTLSVLVLSSVISVVVMSTTLSSLTNLNKSTESIEESKVKQFSQGCMQEALLQINRDKKITSSSFDLRIGSCEISSTNSGTEKTVSVTGTINKHYSTIESKVETEPFEVIKWGD